LIFDFSLSEVKSSGLRVSISSDRELVLELRGVQKDYRALRPLRIRQLELKEAQSIALVGLDQAAAEVFVNLVTGASMPDSGEVRVFGESTGRISDGEAWLASLERFGILSHRAVLLDQLTVAQNLAVPFSLELDPMPEAVRADVHRLASEVGLEEGDLPQEVAVAAPLTRQRVRLGRAVALNPRVLLSEHPNGTLPSDAAATFAADLRRVIASRQLASVTLTADQMFASAVADEVLMLKPATGELVRATSWWSAWRRGG
jgi:ABC-type transporter Mla maintaining outer membrane lipid asymmetry ATPase subunit MlaF